MGVGETQVVVFPVTSEVATGPQEWWTREGGTNIHFSKMFFYQTQQTMLLKFPNEIFNLQGFQ